MYSPAMASLFRPALASAAGLTDLVAVSSSPISNSFITTLHLPRELSPFRCLASTSLSATCVSTSGAACSLVIIDPKQTQKRVSVISMEVSPTLRWSVGTLLPNSAAAQSLHQIQKEEACRTERG
ncbi:hypothetical protein LY76DRAFT_339696 [Colletotrichum caudatum]|nr:hypothetical protein LY76DRAFT_339696 [Colletotrichum caudatum]